MTVSIYTYSLNERRLTQVGVVMCKLKAYIWAYTGILRARGKQGKTVLSFHIKIDMCQMIRSLFFWVVAHLMLVTDIFIPWNVRPIRCAELSLTYAPTLCDDVDERSRYPGRLDTWRWDRLSLRVGYCAIRAAQQPRSANISSTLQLRPEISHSQVTVVGTTVHSWRMFLPAVIGTINSGRNLLRYGWYPSEDRRQNEYVCCPRMEVWRPEF